MLACLEHFTVCLQQFYEIEKKNICIEVCEYIASGVTVP